MNKLAFFIKKLHTFYQEFLSRKDVTPIYWKQAIHELASRDQVMEHLILKFQGTILTSRGCAFTTLARSIIGQQISVRAAESIWLNVISTIPNFTPHHIASTEQGLLRRCGLSVRKVIYLQDLARHFMDGTLDEAQWSEMNDEELIIKLVQVKGIGRWTAQMALIFHLHRPDILPLDDIGLQRAIRQEYNNGQPMNKKTMLERAMLWQPWRSVATWYLWRSLDPLPVEY